jgi:hypothetical protein
MRTPPHRCPVPTPLTRQRWPRNDPTVILGAPPLRRMPRTHPAGKEPAGRATHPVVELPVQPRLGNDWPSGTELLVIEVHEGEDEQAWDLVAYPMDHAGTQVDGVTECVLEGCARSWRKRWVRGAEWVALAWDLAGGPPAYRSRRTFVARRPIAAGDETTIDYALLTVEPTWSMACKCASALCRELVTGEDWRLPELRARYEGHWSPFIERRIRAEGQSAQLPISRPDVLYRGPGGRGALGSGILGS